MLSALEISNLLGSDAEALLGSSPRNVSKDDLVLPGPDWIDRVFLASDRSPQVLNSLDRLFNTGRLAGTGYLSILPVDQGIEHGAGASFAPNPDYFHPHRIIELALEGGCNAVSTTLGAMSLHSRRYAHKIPFIVKINHNELLSYPNQYDQTLFASVEQAWNLGAAAVGATVYFGSAESRRQIQEISEAFAQAHEMGMATVLWCYVRNEAFTVDGKNYETAADITGQAIHLGATIGADLVKQKLPTLNGGLKVMRQNSADYGKLDERMYTELSSDNPIDLTRYQVLNAYGGAIGLLSSGGASGENDLADAVRSAVINKRAGGIGLISGRKAFQKPLREGVELLHAIQDVYLNQEISVA